MHIPITTWYCVKFIFSVGESDFSEIQRGKGFIGGGAILKVLGELALSWLKTQGEATLRDAIKTS